MTDISSTTTTENNTKKELVFSIGELEPALNQPTITEYHGVYYSGYDYYEPPVSLTGLTKLLKANAHHGAIAYFIKNMAIRWLKDTSTVSVGDFSQFAFDYRVYGNAYFQVIKNRFGDILKLIHLPAVHVRRKRDANRYCYLKNYRETVDFNVGEVIHLKEYDPMQSIYGVPQYLGGVNSIILNESATLFRRKYYENGAHMGYILYTSDANLNEKDEKDLKEAIKKSKGPGNFKSMFLNIPNGKKDSVQIIPIGDFSTRDEFEKIKNITRSDILAAWRVNPALAGVIPENNSGFGDFDKITRNYYENEVLPLQRILLGVNNYIPRNLHIGFDKPEFADAT